jgi:trehalose synthase
MTGITDVPIAPMPLERFAEVLSEEQWEEVAQAAAASAERLRGRVIWNVNSTAAGGGVAEMLRSLIAYTRSVGVDARWVVIGGDPDFFALTKRLHNKLHGYPGDGGPLGAAEHEVYARTLASADRALAEAVKPGDVVLLHDPQTAGLVAHLANRVPVVWRCHIGRDAPNDHTAEGWDFLLDYVRPARGFIFSRTEYVPPGLDHDRVTVVPPSIDAFSAKNQHLDDATVAAIMRACGLVAGTPDGDPVFTRADGTPGRVSRAADLGGTPPPPADARLVTQVSRWDRLKDPAGVLQGFVDHVAPHTDAHLVLAGPAVAAVSDDPEGRDVLEEMRAAKAALDAELQGRIHLAALPMDDAEENAAMVNALQRASAVVVQKSLAEGFGLTVAEAMWKARPVVASGVGGIQDQVQHDTSGVLLRDPADLAEYGAAVRGLLDDPQRADRLAAAARERVREEFLNARHLIRYARLLETLTAG